MLEGERKQVTVLFADIRGSTKLLEELDPEVAQSTVDPVLHIMMDAVHRYEGTVNQIVGDGIMALFGAPLAHEDHALRACYAALAMQEEMRRYRQRLGQSEESGLQIGVGMNSGGVVVRSIDNDLNIEYSALGHTSNLAARMQGLAGPGSILMTASTLRQVEGFVEVKSLGGVHAKGLSQLVDAYELRGATSARTRVEAGAARGLTPLVGRNAEIDIFNKLVQRVSAGGGQVLAMIGEPGIGKSRLVHEFTRHQLPAGWLVLKGTSVSYGKATPYFPLIEMLRRYFGIEGAEGSEAIRSQVVRRILELDNTLKDAIPPVLALLGALPDAGTTHGDQERDWLARLKDIDEPIRRFTSMDPQQRRRAILDALKRVCIRESQRQNLLLVFEDLHWIDHETQSFLDGLVNSLPMAHLLVIVNYRPEYNHRWSEKSYYTQVCIEPLQTSSIEEFLSKLLGDNPDLSPLKRLLIKRTEGNPFFAEESVRSLLETGILTGERGAYRPALKVDDLTIPSTVQSVVADRIDRLPVEEKHLLQTAAVIGVIIPFDLLQAVSKLSDDQLFEYLGHLRSAEFIYETNLFPKLEYTFKHALTNEVAYGALLHERKTDLHGRVVRALEISIQNASDNHVEKLAHHAFCGELWDKAVDYLKEAGDTAASRSGFRNAVLYFERALEALRHLPKSSENLRRGIDLRFDARNALFVLNEFKRGFDHLEIAKEAAIALHDDERLGKLLTCMTAHWNLSGNSERAIITGKQALEHTVGQKNIDSNIVAHNWLGVAYHNLGQFKDSIDELESALSLITENRKYDFFGTTGIVSVNCKTWLIRGLAQIGKFSETVRHGAEAIKTATEREHPLSIVFAYYAVGAVALIQGEFDKAITALEHGLKVVEAAKIPVQRPLVASALAAAYAFVGRCDEALRLLDQHLALTTWSPGSETRRVPLGRAMGIAWEVETYMLACKHNEAETRARQLLEICTERKDKGSEAWLRCLLGDILACSPSISLMQVESTYSEALTLAHELGMRPVQARCHLGLGQIYARSRNSSMAQSELRSARELYDTMSMPFWFTKTNIAAASLS
jgi:class 3 adenylate cyclase/tetratricopeptide (TPR) repeat protein